MNRRPPRKFTIDPPPAPDATINPADLPIDPPGWVQSISRALDCQGASQGLAGAITRYFSGLELEGLGDPIVLVWPHGVVSAAFTDHAYEKCVFVFRGRFDVSIRREQRCGHIEITPPMRLGWAAIDEGRELLGQLWRCGGVDSLWDFELPGDRDAFPVNRPVKAGKAKDGRSGR